MSSIYDIPEIGRWRAAAGRIRIPPGVDVPLTARVRKLVDSAPFRRLAQISQLGLVRLIERMDPDGFRFAAWLFGRGPIEDDLDRLGVETTVWPWTTARTPWGLYAMGRAMDRERPGLIYLHASRLIAWLARRRGIPCVERINMSRRPEAGGWSRYRAIDRCFTSLNTVAAAASGPIAGQLTSRGVPPEKVTVLHTFVEGERYRHPELRREARRELGIPAEAVVVLNIGRLVPQKCQADFLESAARCLPADGSLHFVLCGRGPLEESLRRRAGRLADPSWPTVSP